EAVDQHLDRVPRRLRERDLLAQLAHDAVDAHADEASAAELVQLLAMLTLAVADHGPVHEQAGGAPQRPPPGPDPLHPPRPAISRPQDQQYACPARAQSRRR